MNLKQRIIALRAAIGKSLSFDRPCSVKQLAKHLNVNEVTIYRWINNSNQPSEANLISMGCFEHELRDNPVRNPVLDRQLKVATETLHRKDKI